MRAVGGVGGGGAAAAEITEGGGGIETRRTLPPAVRAAGTIFDLAVARLVVGVLGSLAREGEGGTAEDFNFRQQEQLIVGGLNAAALAARAGLLLHFLDGRLHFGGHQV